jgi:hypothetical protein
LERSFFALAHHHFNQSCIPPDIDRLLGRLLRGRRRIRRDTGAAFRRALPARARGAVSASRNSPLRNRPRLIALPRRVALRRFCRSGSTFGGDR